MSVDELLEQLLSKLRDPRQLVVYAWVAWWLWSVLMRGKRMRQIETPAPAPQPRARRRPIKPKPAKGAPWQPQAKPQRNPLLQPKPKPSPKPLRPPQMDTPMPPEGFSAERPVHDARARARARYDARPSKRATASPPSDRAARSLHSALRDRRILRAAVVLGAALERPRSERR